MAKFRRTRTVYVKPRRRRLSFRGRFRRRGGKDRRFSIIGTIGAVGSLFVSRDTTHRSLGQWTMDFATKKEELNADKIQYALSDGIAQYTGYCFKDGSWGIPTATVVLVASGMAASIAGRFGNKHLKKIPMIGRYVKM